MAGSTLNYMNPESLMPDPGTLTPSGLAGIGYESPLSYMAAGQRMQNQRTFLDQAQQQGALALQREAFETQQATTPLAGQAAQAEYAQKLATSQAEAGVAGPKAQAGVALTRATAEHFQEAARQIASDRLEKAAGAYSALFQSVQKAPISVDRESIINNELKRIQDTYDVKDLPAAMKSFTPSTMDHLAVISGAMQYLPKAVQERELKKMETESAERRTETAGKYQVSAQVGTERIRAESQEKIAAAGLEASQTAQRRLNLLNSKKSSGALTADEEAEMPGLIMQSPAIINNPQLKATITALSNARQMAALGQGDLTMDREQRLESQIDMAMVRAMEDAGHEKYLSPRLKALQEKMKRGQSSATTGTRPPLSQFQK